MHAVPESPRNDAPTHPRPVHARLQVLDTTGPVMFKDSVEFVLREQPSVKHRILDEGERPRSFVPFS